MKCLKCGSNNSDDAEFCQECGEKIIQLMDPDRKTSLDDCCKCGSNSNLLEGYSYVIRVPKRFIYPEMSGPLSAVDFRYIKNSAVLKKKVVCKECVISQRRKLKNRIKKSILSLGKSKLSSSQKKIFDQNDVDEIVTKCTQKLEKKRSKQYIITPLQLKTLEVKVISYSLNR